MIEAILSENSVEKQFTISTKSSLEVPFQESPEKNEKNTRDRKTGNREIVK